MAWSRFEPGFTRHPKRLKCGPLASWLWICSVDHCTVYRTDGFLEAASVQALVPGLSAGTLKKAVAALLDVGSWEETTGGYMVHGYLEHNLSKEQAEEAAAAGRRRYHRWQDGRNAARDTSANGPTNALVTPLVTPFTPIGSNEKLLGHQSVSQSVVDSRSKFKDVDSGVDVTARRAPADNPGSGSTPGVLDRGPRSRRPSAGSRPALVGDLVGGVLGTPPPSRYAEILERIKAEKPELSEQEQENQALVECDRQVKGFPR